jgi:hypothetical protein
MGPHSYLTHGDLGQGLNIDVKTVKKNIYHSSQRSLANDLRFIHIIQQNEPENASECYFREI